MTEDGLYALDIETTGLNRFKDSILCVGVANGSFSAAFDDLSGFCLFLDSHPGCRFIAHNGSFDFNFLRHFGLDLIDRWSDDTYALASLLNPRPASLGLEKLAEAYLGIKPYKLDRAELVEKHTPEEIKAYCLKDCEITWKLFQFLKGKLTDPKTKAFIESWLRPAAKFLAEMEWNGVFIDQPGIKLYEAEISKKRDQALKELEAASKKAIYAFHEKQVAETLEKLRRNSEKTRERAKDKNKWRLRQGERESASLSRLRPFNWSSPLQIRWLLKGYYKLDLHDPVENRDSTKEAKLRSLSHPIAEKLCAFRESEKLLTTCLPALYENCEKDGFIHSHYHLGGTRTGRLSSSSPNLQQIPKGPLRSYVQASRRSRVLATLDFAQIEVRIIAEVSKEEELIRAFKEDIDPYSLIAQKLLQIDCPVREIKSKFKKERDVAKTAGLSILYGTGATRLKEVLKKELGKEISVNHAKAFIENYRRSLPRVSDFKRDLEQKLANQKVVHNLLGRPFSIPSNLDLYMKSLNTLVQGSASDLVIRSALNIEKRLKELSVDAQCRLLIHDEQVWELPEEEAELLLHEILIPEMTTNLEKELNLSVPLKVEWKVGTSWEKP